MNIKSRTKKVLRQSVHCLHACLGESYRVIFPLVEADVSVENFNEELDLQRWVHALVGNLQSLLQTLHHPLPVTDLSRQNELSAETEHGIDMWGLTFNP